jgi:glycoside/pentoside/hexuronide:cation symporter, GPH family
MNDPTAAPPVTAPQAATTPLPGVRLGQFAFLALSCGGFNIPLQIYLPTFYATSVGLSLQSVGIIFLCARLWGAVCDPLVGWASDHTHSQWGRRKPWILCGGLLFVAGLAATFSPPAGAGPAWLLLSLLGLCLGWTATSTPHVAWGGELSCDPRQRARVQAYIQTAASAGIFAVLVLPAMLDLTHTGSVRLRVQLMGAFVAVTLLIGLTLIARGFRDPPSAARSVASVHWRQGARNVLRDRLLWRIVGSDFCVALGQGARGAVFLFFVTQYVRLPNPSLFLILQYAIGIFASPLWAQIAYRLGRARTLIAAELTQVAINLLMLCVTPARVPLLFGLIVAQGLTQGSGNLMLRAMIYDVADRHREVSGTERAGLFSSIFNVTTNAAMALSVGAAFLLLARFGFHAAGANDARALRALAIFFAVAPALGHLLSAALVVGLPITDRRPAALLPVNDASAI